MSDIRAERKRITAIATCQISGAACKFANTSRHGALAVFSVLIVAQVI